MRSLILATLPAVLLGACVSTNNGAEPRMSGDTCRAAPGQTYIGRKASAEIGAELLRATDSRELRWVAPDMIVTADYKFGRLTVSYDQAMTIITVSCS